jgi:ABC-2 type transport system permease protein
MTPGGLPLHWAVARRSFRRYSTYRGATFAGAFTNTAYGFIQAYVLLTVFRERNDVAGFDAIDVVTFTFVAQGLLAAMGAFGQLELSERITSGDVVSDLYRPYDLQAWWMAQELGRSGFQLIFRGITPFAVGAVAFHLRLPADAGIWAAFAVSVALAAGISFAWRYAIALSSFWLLDVRGLVQLTGLVFLFFSGFLLPVAFFPSGLRAVAHALPFAAVVELPVEVFLSKHRSVADLAGVFARQVGWLIVLLGLGRVIQSRAWRRVVVQGG